MMSDGQYSDLTDIESDDHRKKPKENVGAGRKREASDYEIKIVMKTPRATAYTVQALYGVLNTSQKA